MRYTFEGTDLRTVSLSAETDVLILKGGVRYEAPLVIRGRKAPLRILSEGAAPAVVAAKEGDGVLLENCQGVSISGIRVVGAGFRRHPGGIGIHIKECEDVSVSGVECEGFGEAGIGFDGVERLTVYGCLVHDNGFSGIATTGGIPCRDVRILHCRVYDQGGDKRRTDNHSGNGIMIYHTHDALVTFCDAAGNGWAQRQRKNNGPVGIWCATGCENIVFRDCISRLNRTQPGGDDGGGFDFDGGVIDSYMEYCYSYKNEGSGCLHCEYEGAGEWRNNEARYCALIGDAWRVPAHGEIVYYTPPDHLFTDGRVRRSLVVPGKNRRAIQQSTPPGDGGKWQMSVSECAILETEKEPAKDVRMTDNVRIPADVQEALLGSAPCLTEPRRLRELPLFDLLEKDVPALAAAAARGDFEALFGKVDRPPLPKPRFTIDLTGRDTTGCDITDGVRLIYDSLLPGVCTRLGGGDSLRSPMPALHLHTTYTLRATARLASPDTIAVLEVEAYGEPVARSFLGGSAGEYASAVLSFPCTDEYALYTATLRVLSPDGEMNVRDIEVYEGLLPAGRDEACVWRRHGDVIAEGDALVIRGSGAYASRAAGDGEILRVSARDASGEVFGFDANGTPASLAHVEPGSETAVDLRSFAGVTIVCYSCEDGGALTVR